MATIKWRSMPSDDGRDGWYAPRQRMGYLGTASPDDMWESNSNSPVQWENRRGGARSMNREDMMMRMRELDEERSHLEHAMQQMGQHIPMVDELNPELVKKLEEVFTEAVDIASNPPGTWEEYLRKKDFAGIVSMESKELLEALKQKKLPKEVKKELTHTLAAILRAGVR